MSWLKPALIAAGFALALYWGWSFGRTDRDQRIKALRDSVAVVQERADSLAALKGKIDTVAAKDSVRTVVIIRDLERQVDSALADARSPQDTLRAALPARLRPRFDLMLGSYEAANISKDSIISEERETSELLRDRVRVRDLENLALQDGWDAEKALRKEIEKPDISIFGLGLELTCGPQVGIGFVTPGQGGAYVGVGCTVGR